MFEAATAANAMAFIKKAPAGMRTLVSHPNNPVHDTSPERGIRSSNKADDRFFSSNQCPNQVPVPRRIPCIMYHLQLSAATHLSFGLESV